MKKTFLSIVLVAMVAILFTSCASSRGMGCPAQEKDFWYKQAGTTRFSFGNVRK